MGWRFRCRSPAPNLDTTDHVRERKLTASTYFLPPLVVLGAVLVWGALSRFHVFPESAFPSPLSVAMGVTEEFHRGLVDNIIASVFRVTVGFGVAILVGIPFGIWLGLNNRAR